MPVRARALALTLLLLNGLLVLAVPPAPTSAAGPKVAIIVGPVGGLTSTYRGYANEVASAAAAAGATVAKAYSPKATWANVKSAVNGASIIVYFGHGNGYPNPYGSTELTDRSNGWGLNRTTSNGDADNWSTTMVYCGEKALLGTLTSSDGSAQWNYCGGKSNSDGITPAAGFTMVYGQAHYAPGFGERYDESDPLTTLSEAQQRVRHYSYPVLALGARAFLATAYGDTDDIVSRVLTMQSTSFADLFAAGRGYSSSTLTTKAHADVNGAQIWVQRTTISGFHFGDPDYWYAFAGDPSQTPDGMGGLPFTDIASSAFVSEIIWLADAGITTGCTDTEFCPRDPVSRGQMATFLARALALPASSTDWFTDDDGLSHEDSINRLADAGITTGCTDTEFCPRDPVSRGQMATFLARALALPASSTDWFTDDDGLSHEDSINRLADAGITTGCTATRFCPSGTVIRQQMAAFLFRALGS